MGLARIGETTKKHHIYQNSINDILLTHNDYAPALIEKCRMNLNIQDYESLKESIRDLIKVDKHSIHAYQYWTFYDLCHVGNLDDARDRFERLNALIQEKESNNFEVLLFSAKLMSRICGRATRILDICIRMLTKCNKMNPLAPGPLVELGNCYYMINQFDKALQYFKDAAGIDLESMDPMVGMLKTMISRNSFDEAEV
jgi:tetratricopeptide (TPR) repeat protein